MAGHYQMDAEEVSVAPVYSGDCYCVGAGGVRNLGGDDTKSKYQEIARAYAHEDFSLCVRLCSELLSTNQTHPLFFMRGLCHFRMGVFEKAADDFSNAITIKPSLDAYYMRGQCMASLEEYDAAFDDFAKALEFDSESVKVLVARACAHVGNGNCSAAIKDAKKAIRIGGYDVEAWSVLAIANYETDENEAGFAAHRANELRQQKPRPSRDMFGNCRKSPK